MPQTILHVDIADELKKSYLSYALSVIVSRAIPDVRDGLKPVHRRILYAMYTMGLLHNRPYKKSARVVGEVLGKYHPHGDTPVYDALVRMAQDFSLRYPLVDGQGNFGSIDGDSPAAMRYTEARLAKIAELMLKDLDKNTVDFRPNFDESLKEPVVLPSAFPNLLVNGSSGIAVGMATNMLPHNLSEVIDAIVYVIDNLDKDISVEELMQFIKGPDFPTGGIILGREGIIRAYTTGHGKVIVRGKAEIYDQKGKKMIIITEIPYQVNKANLLMQIAQAVKEKKLDGIQDIKDESNRKGIRIVIKLSRDAEPEIVLNQLYKHSNLETSLSIINLVLDNNQPRIMSLLELIKAYIAHRKTVVTRRTKYLLDQAESRAHIVQALLKALDIIDDVVNTIKSSSDVNEAKDNLKKLLDIDDIQARAILDMRLQKLTALESRTLRNEYDTLMKSIAEYKSILSDDNKIYNIIKQELEEVKREFGDSRRTEILDKYEEIQTIDLIKDESVVITLTNKGYIKRVLLKNYRVQKKNGRGIQAITIKDNDFIKDIVITSNRSKIYFFTNKGRVFITPAYKLPEMSRNSRGKHIANIFSLKSGERIVKMLALPNDDLDESKYSIMFFTRLGVVKRTELTELDNVRSSGIIAIKLPSYDSLVNVLLVKDQDKVLIATRNGLAIRFLVTEVRPMGRNAYGVRGVNLKPDDYVVDSCFANEGYILTINEKGYGKKCSVQEYSITHRGTKGVINSKITDKNGRVVNVLNIVDNEEILILSNVGNAIRISTERIPVLGRNTIGVKLMKLHADETVAVATKIVD